MPSWRDVLKIHPACELFPLMSQAELKELGEDIKKNGLIEKIKITSGHNFIVIDGRNRLDAMEAAGVEIFTTAGQPKPPFFERVSSDADIIAYVVSANIRRRHLTTEDKRRLIGELLKANPERSNLQTAKLVGASHPTVAKVRSQLEGTGDVEKVSTSTDTKGRQQPVRKPKTVSVKPAPPPTAAQRVEEKIRQAGIADKKKHDSLSLTRVMEAVVAAADREELIVLAGHHAPERYVPARQWCESHSIDWRLPASAEESERRRHEDFLDPSDADKAITMIVKRIDSGLFAPSPGILACLVQAMSRASAKDREAIATAAEILSQLARSGLEPSGLSLRAVAEDACCHL